MTRLVLLLAVVCLAAATSAPAPAAGDSEVVATVDGGGVVYIPVLDIDSRIGIGGVINADGTARGHFNCHVPDPTFPILVGDVSAGALNDDDSVTLGGHCALLFPGGEMLTDLPYTVTAYAGGPGEGLLVLDVPDAGIVDCPEVVVSGHIQIKVP